MAQLSASGRPTGSRRTRMRVSSSTITLPAAIASATTGRFARSSLSCASGRPGPRRRRITDGLFTSRSASRLAKSVSAETRVLIFLRGSPKHLRVVGCLQVVVSHTDGIVSGSPQPGRDKGRQCIVHEESQELPATGSSRSRTAAAA